MHKVTLISLHGPNGDNPVFLQNILTEVMLENYGNNDVIICWQLGLISRQKAVAILVLSINH